MNIINSHNLTQKSKLLNYLCILAWLAAGLMLFAFQDILIAAGGKDLKELSTNVKDQVTAVSQVIIVISYVAGIGFSLVGILQFKAHKESPQQTPLSKPIVFLIVGALLIFLPTVMKSAGQTIFGDDKKVGNTGETSF